MQQEQYCPRVISQAAKAPVSLACPLGRLAGSNMHAADLSCFPETAILPATLEPPGLEFDHSKARSCCIASGPDRIRPLVCYIWNRYQKPFLLRMQCK